MRSRAILLVALAALSGCVSKPFDVKVVPRVEPERIGPPAAVGPLAVRAEAIWDEDWLFDNFDANLVLAGVLAVRVDVENTGSAEVEPKRLEIEAFDAAGRELDLLDAKGARKRIERYYGVSIRSRTGDKLYKQDFDANAVDLRRRLAPGERRQGFLFVELPDGVERRVPVRLALELERRDARAEIAL